MQRRISQVLCPAGARQNVTAATRLSRERAARIAGNQPYRGVKFAARLLMITLVLLPILATAQSVTPADDARSLADQAVAKARAGDNSAALQLFAKALADRPDDVAILRDYATVLGWAAKYPEAMAVIKKVRSLDSNQPDWALREFAAVYLFGDAKTEALGILNDLIARGDISEQTLMRRALALRWMGRAEEAQTAYRTVLQHYPKSADAAVGMAYSLADEGKTPEALRYLDANTDVSPQDPLILKAKIRLLNWSGRHYEAQTMLASLPLNMRDDRDVLEDRITAARWGGNPASAMQDLHRLASLFPGDSVHRISKDLRTEYGQSFAPSFRFGKDSDGLVDRAASAGVAVHVTPAHVLHLGYQYRWLEQNNDVRTVLRYELGWSGDLNRRLAFYTTVGSVDYRTPGLGRKIVGDGTLAVTMNPKLRLSGGAGSLAMDAYQSLPRQVTAPFGFGDVSVNFNSRTRFQARFSRYSFSDAVVRDRADFEFMRSLFTASRAHVSGGWRSNWMRHDGWTDDFWSPAMFQSHVAVVQSEGRLTSWLSYWGELGAGWQWERNTPAGHPFQASGKLLVLPSRHWRLVLEAGKSTSSLDRVLPGQRTYSRWVASGGMEFRFP